MSCGCQGSGLTDLSSIVVNTCCGAPEPAGGWSAGIDFVGILQSSDITAGADIPLFIQGTAGTSLAAPSASQRLYLFHVSAAACTVSVLLDPEEARNEPSVDCTVEL